MRRKVRKRITDNEPGTKKQGAPEPPFKETAMPFFHFGRRPSQQKDDGQPENAAPGDDDLAEATIEEINEFADREDTISLEKPGAETG